MQKLNKLNSLHKSVLSEKEIDKLEFLDKDFGLDISDLLGVGFEVTDEFQMPFKSLPARTSGQFIQKTKTGYYKSSWAVINGNELYIYQNKENPKHFSLFIIAEARIICNTHSEAMVEVKDNIKYSRLYEIQIIQGTGDHMGVFSLYFENLKYTLEWKKALTEASGDFQLHDYYDMPSNTIPIAEGSRSQIFKATHKVHKVEVAVKKIPKEVITDKSQIIRQIDLMKLAVHSNTTRLLDHFQDDLYYYLVIELETGGTLFNWMAQNKNFIREERAREICVKIAHAIDFLHDYSIILGQIDIDSIIMTDLSDSALPRLSKFSKARIIYPGHTIKEHDGVGVGRLLYWAPELCNEQPYDTKIDVWSFGAILFYLLSGQYHVIKRKDNQN